MKYYLYIIKTVDDKLYCGIALDFKKRFEQHKNSKLGAKYLSEGEIIKEPDFREKIEMLKEHLRLEVQHMGEVNGIKFMRKFYNYYISSTRNASKYRSALVVLDKEKEIIKVLDEILSLHLKDLG